MDEYTQLPLPLQFPKLCECGCGKPTGIVKETDSRRGRFKGEPVRFIQGHHARLPAFREMRRKAWAGKPAAMRGRKLTPEHRAKLSAAKIRKFATEPEYRAKHAAMNRGRKAPLELRQRLSACHKGPKGSNWRGGITPINRAIRGSFEYREWRTAVFTRDNYTCQECGKRGRGDLHAHHIKPFASFPELCFDVDNGLTLCAPCHLKTFKKR